MNASDLMVRPPATVHADDSLAHAASVMSDRNCGSVVVVDPTGRAVAMLTERDLWLCALCARRALSDLRVHRAMSSRFFACGPDDDVSSVEDAMSLHQVRRLPVLDADGRALGVVSLDDLPWETHRAVGA
jgi:CBS domain-containing protein